MERLFHVKSYFLRREIEQNLHGVVTLLLVVEYILKIMMVMGSRKSMLEKQKEHITVIFKEQHLATSWFREYGQKDEWPDLMMSVTEWQALTAGKSFSDGEN